MLSLDRGGGSQCEDVEMARRRYLNAQPSSDQPCVILKDFSLLPNSPRGRHLVAGSDGSWTVSAHFLHLLFPDATSRCRAAVGGRAWRSEHMKHPPLIPRDTNLLFYATSCLALSFAEWPAPLRSDGSGGGDIQAEAITLRLNFPRGSVTTCRIGRADTYRACDHARVHKQLKPNMDRSNKPKPADQLGRVRRWTSKKSRREPVGRRHY